MAITKAARDSLGAHIVGHDITAARRLPNGMIKTSQGLIAPPATSARDTRSGRLEDAEEPEQPIEEVDEPVQESPAPAPKKAAKRRKQEPQPEQPRQVSRDIRVVVELTGFGSIPTKYTHCHVGEGILVLGIGDMSFLPAKASQTDDGLTNVVSFSVVPGRKYIYCGNKFTDDNGTENLVMIEVQNE